jgi:fructokinase
MTKTVLCFGEALWDLLPTGPQLGGAPLNLAYRLCCLGDRGLLATRLGRDEYGPLALLRMAELGMQTTHVQWDEQRPTGTVEVRVDARGSPEFKILPRVAYDEIEVTYDLLELAQRVDCICFGTLAQRSSTTALSLARLLGVAGETPRFLDLNLRPDCYTWQTIERALQQATLLKLNADEVRGVAFGFDLAADPLPDFCTTLIQRCDLDCCVVTLGDQGAFATSRDGSQVYDPGYAVAVKDACGSGDAFSAGFLHHWLRGQSLAECCRLGNVLGALVSTQDGATQPLAPAQIEEFISAAPGRIRRDDLIRFEPTSG